jgi:uncharacterized protein GlcG (DUF336 family)
VKNLIPVLAVAAVALTSGVKGQNAGSKPDSLQLKSASLEQADRMIASALAVAERLKVRATVIVLDAAGNPMALARMNGASPASLEGAQMKANTALAFGAATKDLVASVKPGQPLYGIALAQFSKPLLFVPGGVPVVVDGAVIGAVGVGGAQPDQDNQMAEAAISSLK